MGSLGEIEAGLRQLRRDRPLEVEEIVLPSGRPLVVPTRAEALRVKGYLVLQRDQVRDYLDVAAMADLMGARHAAAVLADLGAYYESRRGDAESLATALALRLAAPGPRDTRGIAQLPAYKGVTGRYADWDQVVASCREVAVRMVTT